MTNLGTLIQSAIRLTKNGPVLHPLLIALCPAVFLWSNNVENLSLSAGPLDLMVSMGIPVVFALVAVLFLGFILRDRKKAGLVVALFLLLFFLIFLSLVQHDLFFPDAQPTLVYY